MSEQTAGYEAALTAPRGADDRRTSVVVTLGTLLAVAAVYVVVVLGGGAAHRAAPTRRTSGCRCSPRRSSRSGFEPLRATLRSVVTDRLGRTGGATPYDVLSGFTESVTDAGRRRGIGRLRDLPTRLARHARRPGPARPGPQVWLMVNGELRAARPPGRPTPRPDHGATRDGVRRTRRPARRRATSARCGCASRRTRRFGPIEERLFADLAAQAGHGPAPEPSSCRARAPRRRPRRYEPTSCRSRGAGSSTPTTPSGVGSSATSTTAPSSTWWRSWSTSDSRRPWPARSPDRARAVLDEQVAAVDAAIATLVDLSRGLYPRTLVEHGRRPGPARGVRRDVVSVHVATTASAGLPRTVEAALYFARSRPSRTPSSTPAPRPIAVDLSSDVGRGEPGGPRRRHGLRARGRVNRARARQHARPDRRDAGRPSRWSPSPATEPRSSRRCPRQPRRRRRGGLRHDAHLRHESPGRWRSPAWCSSSVDTADRRRLDRSLLDPVGRHPRLAARRRRRRWLRRPRCGDRRAPIAVSRSAGCSTASA